MLTNLSITQIVAIIVVIIIIIWLGYRYIWKNDNRSTAIAGQNAPPENQATNQSRNQMVSETASMTSMSSVPRVENGNASGQSPYTLYYFYSPQCGHCNNFKPNWDKVTEAVKSLKVTTKTEEEYGVNTKAVDASDNKNGNIIFYYNISALPTVILVTPSKTIEYTGDRDPEDLYKFVYSNL